MHRPPDPEQNNVKTFYERPIANRVTGRYTVAWNNDGRVGTIRVHNRLKDMEGYRPSLASLMRLPATLATYFESKRRAILKKPRPFLVYEAIEHLETLIGEGSRVLELGGGNSTLWFIERGATVVTFEHSSEWAGCIEQEVLARFGEEGLARLTVVVASGDDALASIANEADASFDLALVDCMNAFTWRRDGVEAAVPKVKRGGSLCLDNSDHPNNWSAVTLLGRSTRTRFTGYAPMCPVVTQTSFWKI